MKYHHKVRNYNCMPRPRTKKKIVIVSEISIIERLNLKNRSKMNLILKMQVIQYILQLCASIRRFQMIFYSAHHFAKSTFFEDS